MALGRYVFGTLVHEANIIIQYYLVPCRLSSKIDDLGWPWTAIRLNFLGILLLRPLMLKVKSSENFLKSRPKSAKFWRFSEPGSQGFDKFFLLQKAHLCVNPRGLSNFVWKLVGESGLQVGSGNKVKKVTNIVYSTYLPRNPHWSNRHQICIYIIYIWSPTIYLTRLTSYSGSKILGSRHWPLRVRVTWRDVIGHVAIGLAIYGFP